MSKAYEPMKDPTPWLTLAFGEEDEMEIPGEKHNPRIVEYHQTTTLKATRDEVPWCSSAINWLFAELGWARTFSAAAKSWLKWGKAMVEPQKGCVVVLKRDGGHHVTIYCSADVRGGVPGFVGWGGNQSNRWRYDWYPTSRVLGYRWPLEAKAYLTKVESPPKSVDRALGFDVSGHQRTVDFKLAKAKGKEFVFIKATEGESYFSEPFKKRVDQARAAGLLVGAYHYFHPNQNPIDQARFFAKTIEGRIRPGDLPPVMDWEVSDGVPEHDDEMFGKRFLEELQLRTKIRPIIYGGHFIKSLTLPKEFANYPLWLAHYTTGTPRVGKPWTDWTFWQYADSGDVPGDQNYFAGNLASLKEFCLKSVV